MKRLCFFFFFFLAIADQANAQRIEGRRKRLDIPFRIENNFIVVDVQINRVLFLKFIFDTGAEYTILTKREFTDVLGIQYEREFRIMGSDMRTELVAYLARGVNFKLGEIENARQDILVMGEDYYKFEAVTGVDVHGILGANFFNRYIVHIDYERQLISLYDPQFFKAPKKHTKIPISVYKNKVYIEAPSKVKAQDSIAPLKYLIDTGASLSLMLFTDTDSSLDLPEQVVRGNIGKGLGGDIEGFIGRFAEINLGPYKLQNIIGNFQEIYPFMNTSERNNRNGLIGNVILKRFDIFIDYYNQVMYVKPNKTFRKKFKFDRSGLLFLASGKRLNEFVVNYIVPGSPADEVDIRTGDVIKRINWLPAQLLSMTSIYNKFQGRIGKRIKLTLVRDGKKIQKTFILRDLI